MPKASFLGDLETQETQHTPAHASNALEYIRLDLIHPDPVTAVRSAPETTESAAEFAGRLKREGIAQPILVRRKPDGSYGMIAGRRRWRAALHNDGLDGTIAAYVRDVDDETARRLAFEENYRRKQFSPIDLGNLFIERRAAYLARNPDNRLPNWSQIVANQFGVSRATVTEHVKMLEGLAGDEDLISKVHSGEIAMDAAVLLAQSKDNDRAGQLRRAADLAQEEADRKAAGKTARKPAGKAQAASVVSNPQSATAGAVAGLGTGKEPVSTAAQPPQSTAQPAKPATKPAKIKAKHIKAAARAGGQTIARALSRTEMLDRLAALVDPGYPAVMNAFLNYLVSDWQIGKGDQDGLQSRWRAIACLVDVDTPGCADAEGIDAEHAAKESKALPGRAPSVKRRVESTRKPKAKVKAPAKKIHAKKIVKKTVKKTKVPKAKRTGSKKKR